MKTLLTEFARHCAEFGGSGYAGPSYAEVGLGKYGSYRVVEGALRVDTREHLRCPEVVIDADDNWHYPIGESGDRVTLLLPPEEKEQSDPAADVMRKRIGELEMQLIDESGDCELAYSNMRAEQARADRYEKALSALVAAIDIHDSHIERPDRVVRAIIAARRVEDALGAAREALDDE